MEESGRESCRGNIAALATESEEQYDKVVSVAGLGLGLELGISSM
jgi:hypothetical protein